MEACNAYIEMINLMIPLWQDMKEDQKKLPNRIIYLIFWNVTTKCLKLIFKWSSWSGVLKGLIIWNFNHTQNITLGIMIRQKMTWFFIVTMFFGHRSLQHRASCTQPCDKQLWGSWYWRGTASGRVWDAGDTHSRKCSISHAWCRGEY